MPLRFLKLAMKAKDLPEAVVIGRVLLGLVGVVVLWPLVSNLGRLGALSATDFIGLGVFAVVGGWLVALAVRGPR